MPILKLTDAAVSRISLPPKPRQIDYWDALLPAFGMRVSYSGAKAWLAMVRILENGKWKQTRVTLGRYPSTSLADARELARKAQALAQAGKDPRKIRQEQRRELEEGSRNTYGAVRDRFLAQHCFARGKALRTAGEYERVLKSKDFECWENRPISEITRREVIALFDSFVEAGTPTKANRTLAYLRSMMNWAVNREIIDASPTDRVSQLAREVRRDRFLSSAEIEITWKAFDLAGIFGEMFRILLLTGQRRDEVASMRWSELNLDSSTPIWEIPKERTKMERAHRVPLSPKAVAILKALPKTGEFVFTTNGKSAVAGFSKAKARVDASILAAMKRENLEAVFQDEWRIHDLRRTAATHMAELGVSRDVVELILNHQTGTRSGVAGIYNRSELLDERRRALELWSSHIDELTNPSPKPIELDAHRKTFNESSPRTVNVPGTQRLTSDFSLR